ncbi:MAG TPA: hypothetical protein VE262_21930 [Blastocatellia bacterium]|nr:hypothetical protein [Blastocatellia bacterium]
MKSLALLLDSEFHRVAKAEDISMEQLVSEVSILTEYTTRQIYNFRSGKWDIPSSILPVLCKRFNSLVLLNLLEDEIKEQPVVISDTDDIPQLSIETLGEICTHHYNLLDIINGGRDLDRNTLVEIEEKTERIVQRERALFRLLERAYERQQELKRGQA